MADGWDAGAQAAADIGPVTPDPGTAPSPASAPEPAEEVVAYDINTPQSDPAMEAARKGMQGDYTRKMQDLASGRQQLAQSQQELAQAQRMLAEQGQQPTPQAAQEPDAVKRWTDRLGLNADNYSADGLTALNGIQTLFAEDSAGIAQQNAELQKQLTEQSEAVQKVQHEMRLSQGNTELAQLQAQYGDLVQANGQWTPEMERASQFWQNNPGVSLSNAFHMFGSQKIAGRAAANAAMEAQQRIEKAQGGSLVGSEGSSAPPTDTAFAPDDDMATSFRKAAGEQSYQALLREDLQALERAAHEE